METIKNKNESIPKDFQDNSAEPTPNLEDFNDSCEVNSDSITHYADIHSEIPDEKEKCATQRKKTKTARHSQSVPIIALFVAILTLIGTTYTCYMMFREKHPTTETLVKKTKEQINNKADLILEQFNPQKIPTELDSIPDVKLIREFKIITQEMCVSLKSIDNNISYQYQFMQHGECVVDFLRDNNWTRERICDSLIVVLWETFEHAMSYGLKNNIYEYKIINLSQKSYLEDVIKKQASIYTKAIGDYSDYHVNGEYDKAYDILDKLYNNLDYNVSYLELLDFCIHVNLIFDLRIRNLQK